MVEEVSPIIYKKIEVSNFAKKGYENESLTQSLFYDSVTKKIIQISETGIKIFNKSATRLIKEINLQLDKGKIYDIAVDKSLLYMIILMDKNNEHVILVLNIQYETVINILHGDLKNMLGMFFMNNNALITTELDGAYFTLVYRDRVHYFKIEKDPINLIYETIILLNEVSYPINSLIRKYVYNPQFMILCVQKGDKNEEGGVDFELFNLSDPSFFKEGHKFTIINEEQSKQKNKKGFSLFSLLGSKKKNEEEEVVINAIENYRVNHFFLENIYNRLYIIYLNYDESFIQFYQVKSLIEITKKYEIQFDCDNVNTLQFVDNLILIHNFDRSQTTIIDLKSQNDDKVLYRVWPVSNYQILKDNEKKLQSLISVKIEDNLSEINKQNEDNDELKFKINIKYNYTDCESMLSYNNTNFYGRNFKFHGELIEEKDEETNNTIALYIVYFDPKIYYENSMLKKEAIFNLTRRKNGKETILNGLYEMINSHKKIKVMNEIFKILVKKLAKNQFIEKRAKTQMMLSENKSVKNNEVNDKYNNNRPNSQTNPQNPNEQNKKLDRNSMDLPLTFMLNFFKKKNILTQNDIYFKLLNLFEFKSNVKPEYIIQLLVSYQQQLKSWKIGVSSGFHKTLVLYIDKVQYFANLNIYFQFHSFPDSTDLAYYLIYKVALNENKYYSSNVKRHALQNGIDMFLRLGKYEKVFEVFVKMDKLNEAIKFITKFNLHKKGINKEALNKFNKLCSEDVDNVNDFIMEVRDNKLELK